MILKSITVTPVGPNTIGRVICGAAKSVTLTVNEGNASLVRIDYVTHDGQERTHYAHKLLEVISIATMAAHPDFYVCGCRLVWREGQLVDVKLCEPHHREFLAAYAPVFDDWETLIRQKIFDRLYPWLRG